MRTVTFLLLAFLLLLPGTGHSVPLAAPPAMVNVHGQLVSAGGLPITGARAFVVTFHDAEADGNILGAAIGGTTTLSPEGLFNISVEPPAEALGVANLWYSVGVDTDLPADGDAQDDVFPNRFRVYSVPFALVAGEVAAVDAERVGTGSVDNAELDALDGVAGNVQQQIDAIDTSGIAANAADIAQNTADIADNAADIAQNTADIADNAADIAQNTADIADNAAEIAQNTADIADNTSALVGKADAASVYTQAAADAQFVDAAGDSMSGTLGVDAIVEATADAGVGIEGVVHRDNYVELAAIAAPGDTAGRLYRTAGGLFFNGVQLDSTAFDKDAINNAGTLGFTWGDAEVSDSLTLGSGSTIDNGAFSALADLTAESAIGSGAAQVAAGNHSHNLQDLGGAVTDAQVPNNITIQGGSVDPDSFSALADLGAESAIGSGAGQVAAGNHSHNLQDLGGAVTDAQVPDNITITEADTLASVTGRGATTAQNLSLTGAAQSITFTNAAGVVAINSDSVLGLGIEGITVLNGSMTNVGRVQFNDDSAGSPAMTYSSDPNTGIHRPGADQLALVTGGTARLTVDNAEVNVTGNVLEIGSGTAPGTTTNKLYNVGGNLFFAGTQLNGGGGGAAARTETLNWTLKELSAPYAGFTYFAQRMTRSGTIVSFQAWCNFASSDWTVDLRKNGVSILTGELAFVAETLVEGTLSQTTFAANDVLSLYLDDGTDFTYGLTCNIVVEYD